jgi:hypothetical protein
VFSVLSRAALTRLNACAYVSPTTNTLALTKLLQQGSIDHQINLLTIFTSSLRFLLASKVCHNEKLAGNASG